MTVVVVELAIVLLLLPLAAVALGRLFDRAERLVMRVRARRTVRRSRTAPGSHPTPRGHHRGVTPEHLRHQGYGRFR